MVKEREILKLPGKVFDAIRFGISWGLMTQKKSSNVEKDTDVLDGIDNLKLEQSGSNSTTTNKISIKITDQSIENFLPLYKMKQNYINTYGYT
jgi:hypothetical protein